MHHQGDLRLQRLETQEYNRITTSPEADGVAQGEALGNLGKWKANTAGRHMHLYHIKPPLLATAIRACVNSLPRSNRSTGQRRFNGPA